MNLGKPQTTVEPIETIDPLANNPTPNQLPTPIDEPTPQVTTAVQIEDTDPMQSNCAYCKAKAIASLSLQFSFVLLVIAYSFKLLKSTK